MTGADVSVVVCAHTERRLQATLDCVHAVVAQRPRPAEVVIVVDHAPALADRLAAEVPAEVRVVPNEGVRGLSDARNTGVRRTTRPVVAFVDDDARPRDGWLAELLAPFADAAVAVVGGQAEPRWPGAAPAWLAREFWWVVGCSYTGQVTDGDVRNVIGCNMAFRRSALEAAGDFDPEMGRLGGRPLGCEETELCIRIRQRVPGSRVRAVPGATVDHAVSADRVRPRYFLSRCWHEGLSKARVSRLRGAADGLSAERAYVRRTLPAGVARAVRTGACGRAAAIVAGTATTAAGYGAGQLLLRRDGGRR